MVLRAKENHFAAHNGGRPLANRGRRGQFRHEHNIPAVFWSARNSADSSVGSGQSSFVVAK
jgi:hypothetical protein